MSLPTEKQARKEHPVTTGVLDYFPDAIAAVANVSFVGNQQHNPNQPMHWNRHKSTDQADCIGRHLLQRGTIDDDGLRHSAKMAWRALALLQLELEAASPEKLPQPEGKVYRHKYGGKGRWLVTDNDIWFQSVSGVVTRSTFSREQVVQRIAAGTYILTDEPWEK